MGVKSEISIAASPEQVWKVITDIERSAEFISGIDEVKILNQPNSGIVGLKWEETRTMFGRSASEVMWITEVKQNVSYSTRAEHPGLVYISNFTLENVNGGTKLIMSFDPTVSGLARRIFSAVSGFLFKGATKKMIAQDLEDIKKAVEMD